MAHEANCVSLATIALTRVCAPSSTLVYAQPVPNICGQDHERLLYLGAILLVCLLHTDPEMTNVCALITNEYRFLLSKTEYLVVAPGEKE